MMMDGGAGERENGEEKWSDAGGIQKPPCQRGCCLYLSADGGTLTDTTARIALVIGATANKPPYELVHKCRVCKHTHASGTRCGGVEPRESGDLPLVRSPLLSPEDNIQTSRVYRGGGEEADGSHGNLMRRNPIGQVSGLLRGGCMKPC